ncbi:hypothetical protein [Niveibacterium terrae]|uniref:hypothetical protein n=1 Tax=Niveibacterium terrae TaxID=3373598 RepID=UPI003A915595
MDRTFEQDEGRIIGHLGLGRANGHTGLLRVAAGDTIVARIEGRIALSLLGVDTPELSLPLPDSPHFVRTDDPTWQTFLEDPFASNLPPISLDGALRDYLAPRLGRASAANHYRHAETAARGLEAEIATDLAATGKAPEDLHLRVLFEREPLDAYGRMLGWISVEDTGDWRPPTYNHRMMIKGLAMPYFIWPNVAPFRYEARLRSAVPAPGSAAHIASTDEKLAQAREWYKSNREAGVGVFDPEDPLLLQPFELRYLAQRRAPERWVIDLAKADDRLIPPQRYFEIEHPEDRLFVPDEYLELFLARGWRKG